MKASEEQRIYSKKYQELLDEAGRLQDEFHTLVGEESVPVIVRGSEDEKLVHAYKGAMQALLAHIGAEPDPVRNYRVVSVDGAAEYACFRSHYFMAPNEAAYRMREEGIARYGLDEQLHDGSWVPFQEERRS